jgi:tetratricopeptide (TPR) repeat protein
MRTISGRGFRQLIGAALTALALGLVAAPALADDAGAHYKQGMSWKNQGKDDEAIAAFEKAVAADARHGMAWASLGHLYKKKKDVHAKVGRRLRARDADLDQGRGGVVEPRHGVLPGRSPRRRAGRARRPPASLDPKQADVFSNIGVIKRKKGDTAGALVALEWAVKLAPTDASYQNNYGVALRAANRLPDAAAAFAKAIELAPNQAEYYFNAAVVFRRQEEVDQAIPMYEKAVGLAPDHADAWYDLGYMYKLNHDHPKAIEAFNTYLELNKGADPEAQKNIEGEVLALGGTPVTAPPPKPEPKKKKPKAKPKAK